MARIQQEVIQITISRLCKEDADDEWHLEDRLCEQVESVVEELVDDPKLVIEVVRNPLP